MDNMLIQQIIYIKLAISAYNIRAFGTTNYENVKSAEKYMFCIAIFAAMQEFNNMVLLVWNFEKKKTLVQLNSQE